jgi:branched-chain amino acid transport system ATP-binding protein
MSSVEKSDPAPLAVRGATLKFGGVTALDDVSITVNDDELLAVIGPNGAGKTSLLNVTAGFYHPQKGHVELSGQNVTGLRVDQIARRGMARTFQGTHLFAGQTVIENIMIGRHMLMKSNVFQAFFQYGPARNPSTARRPKRSSTSWRSNRYATGPWAPWVTGCASGSIWGAHWRRSRRSC